MKLLVALLFASQLGGTQWPGPAQLEPAPGPADRIAPRTDAFQQRLAALEVSVSTVVARPIDAWRFDALKTEAERLRRDAADAKQRAATDDTLARIDRFAALAERSMRSLAAAPPRRTPITPRSAPTKLAPKVQLTKARDLSPDDDIRGVLRPVVSKRADAPKYGVVDDRGRLAALVTPTPENEDRLESLLGRRVAIDGQRGFRTDLKRPHVVAERVTALPVRRR